MAAIQGALWEGVLPGVLRGLYVGRRTGVLSFVRGEEQCGVRFRLGNILSADTSVREDRLGETLVRLGRLTPLDLKRAMGFALRDGRRLGAVLLDLGLLDASKLEEAVTVQAHQVLRRVFSWSEGSYEFHEESADQVLDGDVTLRLSTGELILQAARSVRDPDVVRYNLGNISRVLALSADPLLRYQRISLSPVDGYVLSRVDGTLSAKEIIQITPLPPEDVQRSLFGLVSTGVLEYLAASAKPKTPSEERPVGVATARPPAASTPAEERVVSHRLPPDRPSAEEPPPTQVWPTLAEIESLRHGPSAEEPPPTQVWPTLAEIEALRHGPSAEEPPPTQVWPTLAEIEALRREPSGEEAPPTQVWPTLAELEATQGLPAPEDSVPTQRLAPVDTRRLEILEAYDGLALRTHFQVLGVPRDATEAQVREAYFRLAKRFHPDVHHDAALSDLRDKLEEVFTRLGEAYEVLCSPRMRASYERELAPREGAEARANVTADPQGEAEQAAEAIRKGSESLAQERFWEAIRLFEAAIPRAEGASKQQARVLLARAYAKNPGWVKQGEELLLAVLREEPDHRDALLQLGKIYRGQGLRSRALSTLRRVLDLDPAHEEALSLIAELGP
jgi:DnaJ-domain-containing protein 1